MNRKKRRLMIIGSSLAVLGLALGLVLYALNDSVVFFHAPSDIEAKAIKPGTRFRLGGLVQEGSLQKSSNQIISFAVEDTGASVRVQYAGILPDLFREGQGVVADGVLETSGLFRADSVLARHDENYMPREVADALREQGHWQGETGSAGTK
ncbi:cytochrome c maturation protein CcmE [Microvirga massiliensis]|uniref:cytochrome c maturation protein CcmE n=1 Tax=Microvirga massiliensis TaxID=1033741 RepID=UPI00062B914A|nr:cytochrome c maturation protein CcmE [Microvirga massiliensis]